jgi:hypothetical protein
MQTMQTIADDPSYSPFTRARYRETYELSSASSAFNRKGPPNGHFLRADDAPISSSAHHLHHLHFSMVQSLLLTSTGVKLVDNRTDEGLTVGQMGT